MPIVPPRWWYTYLARILGVTEVGQGNVLPYEKHDVEYYALAVALIVERFFHTPSVYDMGPYDMRLMWTSSYNGYQVLRAVTMVLANQGGKLPETDGVGLCRLPRAIHAIANIVSDDTDVYNTFLDVVNAGRRLRPPSEGGIMRYTISPSHIAVARVLLDWLDKNGWREYISCSTIRWNEVLDEGISVVGDSPSILPPPFAARLSHIIFHQANRWWERVANNNTSVTHSSAYRNMLDSLYDMVKVLPGELIDEIHRFLVSSYPYRGMWDVSIDEPYSKVAVSAIVNALRHACLMVGYQIGDGKRP